MEEHHRAYLCNSCYEELLYGELAFDGSEVQRDEDLFRGIIEGDVWE